MVNDIGAILRGTVASNPGWSEGISMWSYVESQWVIVDFLLPKKACLNPLEALNCPEVLQWTNDPMCAVTRSRSLP